MQHYSGEDFVNVGVGDDVTIRELAEIIQHVVGYEGQIVHDLSKPDGTPRKLMDVSRLKQLGWTASIPLAKGVQDTYRWFLSDEEELRL